MSCPYAEPAATAGYGRHVRNGEPACPECLAELSAYRNPAIPKARRWWPADPLRQIVEARGLSIASMGRRTSRAIHRNKITTRTADEAAIQLGLHPAQIWSDWHTATEDAA
ncbi:MAG: hypothetical protein R2704_19265 [Microthrixaceae bacterium]